MSVGAKHTDTNDAGQGAFDKAVEDNNDSMLEYLMEKNYLTGLLGPQVLSRLQGGEGSGDGKTAADVTKEMAEALSGLGFSAVTFINEDEGEDDGDSFEAQFETQERERNQKEQADAP